MLKIAKLSLDNYSILTVVLTCSSHTQIFLLRYSDLSHLHTISNLIIISVFNFFHISEMKQKRIQHIILYIGEILKTCFVLKFLMWIC